MSFLLLIASLAAPNWSAHTFDLRPNGPSKVTLEKGLWEKGDPVEERVTLRGISKGDVTGDGKDEAVLLFEYWGGGQERNDFILIYTPSKSGWGRLAHLDGGWGRDGTIDSLSLEKGHLVVAHDVLIEGAPPMVLRTQYQVNAGHLQPVAHVDFRARNRPRTKSNLAERRAMSKAARAALTADPAEGARAYLRLHAEVNGSRTLADAAFALMKAKSPHALGALEAAAHKALKPKVKGATLYNLARFHLDNKNKDLAIKTLHRSLAARPKNKATRALLKRLTDGQGVRQIDWANAEYPDGAGGLTRLKDGRWELNEDDISSSLTLVGVRFGDLTGDGKEEALIHTNSWGGGTEREDALLVYDGDRQLIGRIPGGDRADGGIDSAEIKGSSVHVARLAGLPFDGACCPHFVFHETYNWQEGAFKEDVSKRTLGTLEGTPLKSEAKVLKQLAGVERLAKDSTEEAQRALVPLLATKAHRAAVYSLMGYLFMKDGGWNAVPVLEAALNAEVKPKRQAAILHNLGRAQEALIPHDKTARSAALAAYERSLKLRPGNAATQAALSALRKATP